MRRVLIVEDDDSTRRMIAEMLKYFKYETIEAKNGSAALGILMHDSVFDAVITDLRMPAIDGIRFTAIVKAGFGLPVIAISVNEDLLYQAENKGADCSLQKPFTCMQLLDTLHSTHEYAEARV